MLRLLITLLFLAAIYYAVTQYYAISPSQQETGPRSIPHNIESQVNKALEIGQQRLKAAEEKQ